MTLSIHRAAWALTLALGIPALLLADRTARQIVPKTQAQVPDQEVGPPSEVSTPDHLPEDVDSGGPGQVSQEKPADVQGEESSRRKPPARKSASRRRAEQILGHGRLALERGELRRAKQLLRLAVRARARFDQSDPDSPANLRDAIAEAERAAIREMDAIHSEPESSDPAPGPIEQLTQEKQPPNFQEPKPVQSASVPVLSTPSTQIPISPHRNKQQQVALPAASPQGVAKESTEQIEEEVEPIVQVAHEAGPALPAPEPAQQGLSAEPAALPWRRIYSHPPRRLSQDALAQRLLADARRAIAQGDLNRGAALALRAKGLYVKYADGSDTPDKILREVVKQNRRRGFRPSAPPSPEAEPTAKEVAGNSVPHDAEPPSAQNQFGVTPVSGGEDDSVSIRLQPSGGAEKSGLDQVPVPPMEPTTEFEASPRTYVPEESLPFEASPPTYAPEGSLPSVTPPEDFQGTNPGAFSVPSLEAELHHGIEPACSSCSDPQGHGCHDGHPCKLSCWERILRILHPTHRCTPTKLPGHRNGFAGYRAPRWHRSPSFHERSWSQNGPGESPSKKHVLPPATEVPPRALDSANTPEATESYPGLNGPG